MSSAFIVMDVTNPEKHPRLLAEIKFADLGFTTCFPAVIVMKAIGSATPNGWYLVLGSGPHGTTGADFQALSTATSDQPAKIVIVDLSELGKTSGNQMMTLSSAGAWVANTPLQVYASLDTTSYISDPIVVDYELDYKADAVYFGTVSNPDGNGGWDGKLRRIVINNDATPSNWTGDSTLIDLTSVDQPIVAPAAVAIDGDAQRWVYVGTGRFFTRSDVTPAATQSYYGIKEPYTLDMNGDRVYGYTTVTRASLLDVTNADVKIGGEVTGVAGLPAPADFDDLLELVAEPKADGTMGDKKGWYIDFASKERNLGQASLLGDVLTFTTYIPSADVCAFEGSSNLYLPFFTTGTAYYERILNLGGETVGSSVIRKTSLGQGLSVTPNIHTGREAGSKAFIQTSTGNIMVLQESNPGATKSGKTSWEHEDED
jgi:type IV pilus assembly protein PilY1